MDPVSKLILEAVQPGSIFLGAIAACILYGITCLQTYIFFYKNHRDSRMFKLLIYALWVLDTLHLAMIIHGLYFYLIQSFGNASAMLKPTWSLLIHVYFTIVSDLLIRSVFGKRVWTLSRSYVLTGGIVITTIACAVTGTIFTTKAFSAGGYANFGPISGFLYGSLGSGVAVDVLIAASLCVGLSKTRTGFKGTDNLVNILMAYAVNTSLLTTLCSIGCLITYAIWPEKLTFLGIYFCLSKLYLNSLLAALNARQSLREKIAGLSTNPTSMTAAMSDTQMQGIRSTGIYHKEEYYELESSTPVTPTTKVVVNIDRHVSVSDQKTSFGQVGVAF